MNIKLSLKNHCIQTEIKRQYNKMISEYFNAGPSDKKDMIENKIDLLKHALEDLDFEWLRSSYPQLRGNNGDDIILSAGPDKQLTILINNRPINATHKNYRFS
jgi:hypothetical protein